MRIAIFSDVHANIEALAAVFDAYKSERIDKYVCIGDVVGYGASPNECCDLIRTRTAYTILGNHDAAVAGRMDYSYYYDAARAALDMHSRQISPENMAWLRDKVPGAQVARLEVEVLPGSGEAPVPFERRSTG